MKKQITIRGFDDDLESRLKATARKNRTSLNQAAILLLRKGAGLRSDSDGPDQVGSSLDGFVGSWSSDEEKALLESIADLEQPDPDLWS